MASAFTLEKMSARLISLPFANCTHNTSASECICSTKCSANSSHGLALADDHLGDGKTATECKLCKDPRFKMPDSERCPETDKWLDLKTRLQLLHDHDVAIEDNPTSNRILCSVLGLIKETGMPTDLLNYHAVCNLLSMKDAPPVCLCTDNVGVMIIKCDCNIDKPHFGVRLSVVVRVLIVSPGCRRILPCHQERLLHQC